MSFIKITPEAVRELASELETLGKNMQATMNQVDAKVKGLRADWQDAVKENYDAEFEQLKQGFDSFVESSIPAYAREARDHADAMERIGH